MLSSIVLKIIPVSIILLIWGTWIVALRKVMLEHPWKDEPSHRLLGLLHPILAKIAIIMSYLITGLIATVPAALLIKIIL